MMLDELELLKKDWQKKEDKHPKVSYTEIHNMIWKKSSSIVRWILIISILEITLPHLLYVLPNAREGLEVYDKLGLTNITTVLTVVAYGITFYFIYLFYKRYKEISTLDSAKDLMEKIIKTRQTVKYYVIYTFSYLFITFALVIIGIALSDNIGQIFPTDEVLNAAALEKHKATIIWAMTLVCLATIAIMAGIYFLLYGRLLRKLNKNYNELKQLEF